MRATWIALGALLLAALPVACGDDSDTGGSGGSATTSSSSGSSSSGISSSSSSSSSSGSGGGGGQGGGGEGGAGGVAGVCGDGIVDAPEACDDDNAVDGDGCTDCAIDTGFTCTGEPSTCTAGSSQVVTAGPGLALDILDDAYIGTLDSMTCASIDVPTSQTIAAVAVSVAITHTYVGDLVIKLVSPASTVITLLSRPGGDELVDDGNDEAVTNNANIDAAADVTFQTGTVASAEDMGGTIADEDIVCQTDGICDYSPAAGSAQAGDLTTFAGEDAAGTWQLCVGDSVGDDLGRLDAVTLTIL